MFKLVIMNFTTSCSKKRGTAFPSQLLWNNAARGIVGLICRLPNNRNGAKIFTGVITKKDLNPNYSLFDQGQQ